MATKSKAAFWTGWVLSVVPALLLLFSGVLKIVKPPPMKMAEEFDRLGWNMTHAMPLGVVEILCVLFYLLPRTAVLGAILLTGYLGGATATHVRIGDQFVMPIVVGVVIWLGLYLRDDRLRALAPLRS